MHTTQHERAALAHKIIATRPADCPIRELVAWLVRELRRSRERGRIGADSTRRDAQVVVVNINADQVALFGGNISNN